MQSRFLEILAVTLLTLTVSEPAVAQVTSHRLTMADSLFAAGRYTQSFDHYQQMLLQKEYTPAMLLKMAYIKEGLVEIGPAMYYLNLYYLATNDDAALAKMEELARKYNLDGYESGNGNVWAFYRTYRASIGLALGAMVLLFFAIAVYTRRRLGVRPVIAFSFLTFFALLVGAHLYFGADQAVGIITHPKTYVMSGPSAAADVLEVIGDGHRVQVLDRRDVWLKVAWNNRIVYVREGTLRPVRF